MLALAAAQPQPGGGDGDAEVAARTRNGGSSKPFLPTPFSAVHDAEVDRRPPCPEAAHPEAERVARVDRGDRELGEAPGDVPVVGEGRDEQRQEPERRTSRPRGTSARHSCRYDEREVRRERDAPRGRRRTAGS